MNVNCTKYILSTAAVSLLALGGMAQAADQAANSAPGRAAPVFGAQPIGVGNVIWDNGGPDGVNGLSHFEGMLDTALERDLADDFTTGTANGSGWLVNGVQMSGVWFDGTGAETVFDGLRVRIYADNAGAPGAVVADTMVAASGTETGGVFFTRPEVSYTGTVNIILDENTTYWAQIQPVGTTDNFFHLTSATEGGGGTATCAGSCGDQSPDGCYCDEDCCGFGDCCPDKFEECGGCDPGAGLGAGDISGAEAHIRGDFDPVLPDWTPASTVFGDVHDVTFTLFGTANDGGGACEGNLNGDNTVNVSDLLILLGAWGSCPGCAEDLNDDDVVNVSDMLILLGNWGECPAPPDPEGACCFEDGSCEQLTEADCDTAGGNYSGNFSQCGFCPQPPNGESCDLALPIAIGDDVTADTSGNPVGDSAACGDVAAPNSGTVWYTVVGDGTELTADACNSNIPAGTNVAVFCGDCGGLNCVDGSGDNLFCGNNSFNGSVTWCAGDGDVYYIAVWGAGAEGEVSLSLTSNEQSCTPDVLCSIPNDECPQAIDISGNIDGAPVEGTNVDASDGGLPAGSPSCHWQGAGSPVTSVVWYKFTATAEAHTISLCDFVGAGDLEDSQFTVFSGGCGSLVEVGCGEDDCGLEPPYYSEASFATTIGQEYHVALGNPNFGNPGTFSFTITSGGDVPEACPEHTCDSGTPEGEGCGEEADINGGCNSDPEIFSSISLGETICGTSFTYTTDAGASRDTDWYELDLTGETGPTEVTWSVEGDFGLTGALVIIASGTCPEPTIVADGVGDCTAEATACLEPGVHYLFVAPGDFNGMACADGPWNYTATATGVPVKECDGGGGGDPPANNECVDAVDVTSNINGAAVTGDNSGATLTGDLPAGMSCQFAGTPTAVNSIVWFSFEAPATSVSIDMCGSAGAMIDGTMVVLEGSCGSFVEVGCGEDECGGPGWMPQYQASGLTVGETYYIALGNSGFTGQAQGDFSFLISTP